MTPRRSSAIAVERIGGIQPSRDKAKTLGTVAIVGFAAGGAVPANGDCVGEAVAIVGSVALCVIVAGPGDREVERPVRGQGS